MFGDHTTIPDENVELTVRVHDECNGSDVFGSDICTCRPYLIHGIEECIRTAQRGGAGIIVYFRKEGRALGEVTKYLVYNRRKRQEGGDTAAEYFNCTQHVAGVTDMRFQVRLRSFQHPQCRRCRCSTIGSRLPCFAGAHAGRAALAGCHTHSQPHFHE